MSFANMARKPTKPTCSFCDELGSEMAPLLHRDAEKGPWICQRCVWAAVECLNEEEDETRCDVYVSTSPIHERGVFAGQFIRKGTYVGTYQGVDDGPIRRSNEAYVIYNYEEEDPDDDAEPIGWRVGTNEFRFLNHSDDPNLEMDEHYHFWARRNIRRNEELTWYYGEEFSRKKAKK